MKKLGLVLLAVLFTLSLVTCGLFEAPPVAESSVEWDDGLGPLQPGEFFVGLNNNTTRERALTSAIAQAGADFYEVVLVKAGGAPIVHRATFRDGRIGRIQSPGDGNYNNAAGNDTAYIFAGRNDDKTLLGIGTMTSVDNGTGTWTPGAVISTATTRVQFSVQALTNNVNTLGDDTSTFKPWAAAAFGNEALISRTLPIEDLPLYIIPIGTTGIATYDITTSHFNGIHFLAPTAESVITKGYIWADGDVSPTDDTILIASVVTPPIGIGASPHTGIRIPVTITTTNFIGLGRLSINVAVHAHSITPAANQTGTFANPITWYLRGGINNALVDQGKEYNDSRGSMGGAVLIGVGNVLEGGTGLQVTPDGTTP